MHFSDMSAAEFLAQYWQRKPLLIKQAFPGFADPIAPEELAGLACEPDMDARLVFTRRQTWKLKNGPLAERDFTSLPSRNWTLLVQAVDQWVPEIKQLIRQIPFLPNWRVDDVMVSYATPNGGVGPHFDYYDVFLVQGQGSRLWKTGQRCNESDVLRNDGGLKLLSEFHMQQEWLLECGDALYVPPGIAHWGVSQDNSLCYSIGFRAPSVSEMLLGYSESLSERFPPDRRYTDPRSTHMPQPGEMDAAALKQARKLLNTALKDDMAFARWFGCHMTEPHYPELIECQSTTVDIHHETWMLMPNPASRFAWQQHTDTLLVFADGICYDYPWSVTLHRLAMLLPQADSGFSSAHFRRHHDSRHLLEALLQQGSLLVGEEA